MSRVMYCIHGRPEDHDWEYQGQAYVCIADMTLEEYQLEYGELHGKAICNAEGSCRSTSHPAAANPRR